MNYKKEIESQDFAAALSLKQSQIDRLTRAIENAYDQAWHEDGPNIDQINAAVAPFIETQEEAFYTASVIFSDVFGAMMVHQMKK